VWGGKTKAPGLRSLGSTPGYSAGSIGLLSDRHIACGSNEFGKPRIGNRVPLDGEGRHRHGVDRGFFGVEAGRAHPERSARQVDQLGERQSDFRYHVSMYKPIAPTSAISNPQHEGLVDPRAQAVGEPGRKLRMGMTANSIAANHVTNGGTNSACPMRSE